MVLVVACTNNRHPQMSQVDTPENRELSRLQIDELCRILPLVRLVSYRLWTLTNKSNPEV
jgi:hypothetical protein